jgi:hypothetical protein
MIGIVDNGISIAMTSGGAPAIAMHAAISASQSGSPPVGLARQSTPETGCLFRADSIAGKSSDLFRADSIPGRSSDLFRAGPMPGKSSDPFPARSMPGKSSDRFPARSMPGKSPDLFRVDSVFRASATKLA